MSCKHVLKMFWKTSWRRLENVLTTSSRRLEDIFGRRITITSGGRLLDVLEDKKFLRWRRLGKQKISVVYKLLLLIIIIIITIIIISRISIIIVYITIFFQINTLGVYNFFTVLGMSFIKDECW